jgi:hypothetical protein
VNDRSVKIGSGRKVQFGKGATGRRRVKGEGVIRKSNKGGDFDQSMHAWKYHSENPLFTINTC